MTTKTLIRKGIKLLEPTESSEQFATFSKVYPMTTENIKDTYALFDLRGKDILTVTSSGDHIFSAILNGAKSVDGFDINYLTEYYYFFKKAMIERCSLEEFKNFLLYSMIPTGEFKAEWYEKFRDGIEPDYQEFWDEIIGHALSNNLPLNRLFLQANSYFNLIDYLTDENYELLRETLGICDVNFMHSDLNKLGKKLDRNYDYMFLSNISDYNGVFETKKLARTKLMGHLNDDGEIVYAYMYDVPPKVARRYEKENYYPITSAINGELSDYVLTLHK